MGLRGIYDKGGVRKQNGHYQSSIRSGGSKEHIIISGTFCRDVIIQPDWIRYAAQNANGNYGLIKQQVPLRGGKTELIFKLTPNKKFVLEPGEVPFIAYSNMNMGHLHVGFSENDISYASWNDKLIRQVKYQWSTSQSRFEPTHSRIGATDVYGALATNDGLLKGEFSNWSDDRPLYLWELDGFQNVNVHDPSAGRRYAGVKLTITNSVHQEDNEHRFGVNPVLPRSLYEASTTSLDLWDYKCTIKIESSTHNSIYVAGMEWASPDVRAIIRGFGDNSNFVTNFSISYK